MKKSKQCPKCDSLRIGYLESQPDKEEYGCYTDQVVGRKTGKIPVGLLEAYVCTDCGYHETYVKDLPDVPWEKIDGFRWVNPPQQDEPGPYR